MHHRTGVGSALYEAQVRSSQALGKGTRKSWDQEKLGRGGVGVCGTLPKTLTLFTVCIYLTIIHRSGGE